MFSAELVIKCNNHSRFHQDPSEMSSSVEDLGQTSLHNWRDDKMCSGLDPVIKHKPQPTFIPTLLNSQSFSGIPHISLPEISGLSSSELGTVCVFLSKLWEIKLFFMVLAQHQLEHFCVCFVSTFQFDLSVKVWWGGQSPSSYHWI